MEVAEIIKHFKNSGHPLLLLDYDGTLVHIQNKPELVEPTPKLLAILTELYQRTNTTIVIVTGRSAQDIQSAFETLPFVQFIAEHGSCAKQNGEWRQLTGLAGWQPDVLLQFQQATDECPGSFIEQKNFSVAWHYREAGNSGRDCAEKLITSLNRVAPDYGLRILDGKKVVEVTPMQSSKGSGAFQWLEKNYYDFVLAIGDDITDEDLFRMLNGRENCYTAKVGPGNTCAQYRLRDVEAVLDVLQDLYKMEEA